MVNEYQCPKCHSHRVRIGYPDIECLDCHRSEPLIDYPVSWSYHRSLCMEYGLPDPGPCDPPEHSIEELHERIVALEEKPQIIEKSVWRTPHSQEKPRPGLHGGGKL